MKIGKKKKKVEEEVVELKEVQEEPTEPILEEDLDGGDIGLVEEVIIEATDEVPKDAKIVEEVVIEPVDKIEEPKEEEFRFGDKVTMRVARDYNNKRLDVDIFDPYTVYAIEGDKVQLRKGHLIIFTKLSNIRKQK